MIRPQPKRVVRPVGLSPRLVGAPPEPEITPTTAPAPQLEPKRRGRPPKFGVALTAAERKAASRAWQKEKQQDAERRNFVAEILKITRRELSKPGEDITAVHETKINEANRKYLRSLHGELLDATIEQLQTVLETKKNTPDSKGRLHDERSGEAERSMGQSEIERILGGMQHDSSLFETGDEDADLQDPNMARGFQVHADGAGPDSFEEDRDADSADVRSGAAKPNWKPTADEKWLKKAITSIVSKLNLSFDSNGAQCPFCSELLLIRDAAVNHLEERYGKEMRDYQKWFEMSWSLQQIHLNGGPWVKPGPGPMIPHLRGVHDEIERVRKQARKKPKSRTASEFRDILR